MSVKFSVKNRKRPLFMGYFSAMSVGKAVELVPDLSVFGIDESAQDFNKEAFLSSYLNEHECVVLGVFLGGVKAGAALIGRDNEAKSYWVRVNTPATIFDWILAISYLQILSRRFASDIKGEDGEIYDRETIKNLTTSAI